LGNKENVSVRIGGLYALQRIAKDSKDDLPTIIDVIRTFLIHPPYQKEWEKRDNPQEHLPNIRCPDVCIGIEILKNLCPEETIKLHGAWWGAFNLSGINLSKLDLTLADLSDANLNHATCNNSDLSNTHLLGADLHYTRFIGSDLNTTRFDTNTKCDETDISDAKIGTNPYLKEDHTNKMIASEGHIPHLPNGLSIGRIINENQKSEK